MARNKSVRQSRLRIGRGSHWGRHVYFTEQADLRPTLGKVRESVFNMIHDYAGNHGFIDLCSGSGIMGFEAVSVGFDPVVFLDINPLIIRDLKSNAASLEVNPHIIRGSAWHLERLGLKKRPWILFSDPPYRETNFHQRMLSYLNGLDVIAPESLYIAEQDWQEDDTSETSFSLFKEKQYGRVRINIWKKDGSEVAVKTASE